jgi:hypothetical protein
MAGHIIQLQVGWCHLSCPNIYRYHGLTFEFHPYCGISICNKDGNPRKNPNIGRRSGKIIEAWLLLSPSKQKRTLIFS